MKFKEMAREMSDAEVERCMSILIEDSVVLGINRDIKGNTIKVIYRVIGDNCKEQYTLTLMSDEVNGLYGDSQSEKRSLFQTRSSKEKGNCNRL